MEFFSTIEGFSVAESAVSKAVILNDTFRVSMLTMDVVYKIHGRTLEIIADEDLVGTGMNYPYYENIRGVYKPTLEHAELALALRCDKVKMGSEVFDVQISFRM